MPLAVSLPPNLSLYQEFVDRTNAGDDDVVFKIDKTSAPHLTSSSTKTISQRLYRFFFAQKKSDIVQDFSAALQAKYGEEVASFAFSTDQKQAALNAGLSKRIIKQVIENASFARRAKDDLQAYAEMAEINIQLAEEAHPGIEISELREKFKKIQNFANCHLRNFKNIAALQASLQEAMTVATISKKFVKEQEKIFQASLKETRLQHTKVMAELTQRFQTNPKALEAELKSLSTLFTQVIEKVAAKLALFVHHFDKDLSACFYLDASGTVALRPADLESQPTAEENQKIWHALFETLETCYGKPLLQRVIPEENREALFSSPLTVAHVRKIFDDIEQAEKADLEFLKKQPLIVDDNYCNDLAAHSELLYKALEDERQLEKQGTSSVKFARQLFDVGVLTAGYHAGGFIAGGAATIVAAATGIAVPVIPLSFVISPLCAFVAGKIVGSRISTDVGSFTAYRAAAYTIGDASTELATEPFIQSLKNYLLRCFADNTLGHGSADAISFLTQFLLEEGGSILADSLRQTCIGSVVNGIDIDELPAPNHELRPGQAADMDARVIEMMEDVIEAVDHLSVPTIDHEQERTRVRL